MWYLAFMNEYDYKKEGVNVKIERETVISGLLLNGSIRNTANALGVSPSTIYRICNENGFKEEFDKAKMEILQGTCAKLTNNLLKAVDVVTDIMNNTENSPQIRLNASNQLFSVALRLNEQCELLARIETIEKRLENSEQND